ncbi:uncharacterized protein [Diadema antillarum]|uniref:uncharacterized protein n=1 Tax=Diadema antillarum TaxID=105358 RepID=UPI003A8B3093
MDTAQAQWRPWMAASEKKVLMDLVKQQAPDLLQPGEVKRVSKDTWETITSQYNARTSIRRSTKQLKSFLKNILIKSLKKRTNNNSSLPSFKTNFTPYEKRVLINLAKNCMVLFSQLKDGDTQKMKRRAWSNMMWAFNRTQSITTPRTAREIKTCIMNMLNRSQERDVQELKMKIREANSTNVFDFGQPLEMLTAGTPSMLTHADDVPQNPRVTMQSTSHIQSLTSKTGITMQGSFSGQQGLLLLSDPLEQPSASQRPNIAKATTPPTPPLLIPKSGHLRGQISSRRPCPRPDTSLPSGRVAAKSVQPSSAAYPVMLQASSYLPADMCQVPSQTSSLHTSPLPTPEGILPRPSSAENSRLGHATSIRQEPIDVDIIEIKEEHEDLPLDDLEGAPVIERSPDAKRGKPIELTDREAVTGSGTRGGGDVIQLEKVTNDAAMYSGSSASSSGTNQAEPGGIHIVVHQNGPEPVSMEDALAPPSSRTPTTPTSQPHLSQPHPLRGHSPQLHQSPSPSGGGSGHTPLNISLRDASTDLSMHMDGLVQSASDGQMARDNSSYLFQNVLQSTEVRAMPCADGREDIQMSAESNDVMLASQKTMTLRHARAGQSCNAAQAATRARFRGRKESLGRMKKRLLQEEFDKRLALMQEEHDVKLSFMKDNHAMLLEEHRWKKEEHELRMNMIRINSKF